MRSEIIYPLSHRSAATRLAVGFVCFSALWVVGSDYLLNAFALPHSLGRLQTEKGLIYVVVSGLLIWLSVRAMERDEANRRALNESRLRRLKESGLLGVADRRPDGQITYVNETLAQMLGYSYHELIGMQMTKLLPSTYDHLQAEANQQLDEFGRTSLLELELLRKDGSRVPILGGRARLDTHGEEIVYFIDITQLKRSEEQRSQLQQQLLHSEKINAIGRFAGGIAHDFNNELAVIVGYGSLLYARVSGDEMSCSNVSQILKAAERSRDFIRQLLAFSRKQELRQEVVDLNETIAEMGSMLRPLLNEDIEFRVLASGKEECAAIDKSQFQQIMINLVMNARDAMPNGGVLTIAVGESVGNSGQEKVERSRESVVVRITDTGTGIEDSIQSKIFEPFFTTKEQSGGTGLGLAMVYGIVKQNNGDIEVVSKAGEGASFILKFPRVKKPAPSKNESALAAPTRLRGTVLLAEDRGDLREMLAEILVRNGLHVLVAFDGENAVKIARETEETIDLVISDVMMPRMNGPDAVRRIRVSRPTVKVIYLSGYTELVVPEENDILIAKPVTPQALIEAINNCLVGTVSPVESSARRTRVAA